MQLYESQVIRTYVSGLLEHAPRGTQAKLARYLDAPVQTINKWAQNSTCPSSQNWPGIERFFGLEPGTIAGLGGLSEQKLSDAETALLNDEDLTDEDRETVLRVYRSLRTARGSRVRRPHLVSPSESA